MALREEVEELLRDDGPSALVLREILQPAEGPDAPFCAPTFAPPEELEREERRSEPLVLGKGKEEMWGGDLRNAVIVDTVESQANRMEKILKEKYPELVPQIILKMKTKKGDPIEINLLDLGHRIADGLIRFSGLRSRIDDALQKFTRGNHLPLALISPTSLIFGFWDSRETGAKWPRLLRSEIWAYNVLQLSRKGIYKPAVMEKFRPEDEWKIYTEELDTGALGEKLEEMGDEKERKEYLSSMGLSSCPWPEMTNLFRLADNGRIERIASLHLVGLRSISAEDSRKTDLLRKYILGLSLVLMTYPQRYDLRQGCLLVRKENPTFEKVYPDGKCQPLDVKHEEVLEFTRGVVEELKKEGMFPEKPEEFDMDFSRERVEEVEKKTFGKKGQGGKRKRGK